MKIKDILKQSPFDFLSRPKALFLLAVIIESLYALYLIIDHRMPAGHDGFQYFTLQYYFLNNVVQCGEVPLWIPFMTHGTVSTWWYVIQASMLQNIYLIIAPVIRGINFLTLFNVSIFFDTLILITGTWALSRRFFSSPAASFFTTVTATGSCIFMVQPWYNFHFYYAIPLIIYFGHLFLDSGKWRYLFLCGNLTAIQTFGNLPYFIPVTSLVVFLYFFAYAITDKEKFLSHIRQIKLNRWALLAIVGILLSFTVVFFSIKFNTELILSYNYGRDINAKTTLDGFLSYASNTSFVKWWEMVLGVSPAFDYDLIIGLLPLMCIIFAVFMVRTRSLYRLMIVAGVLFLFSSGTFIAALFYKLWPFMSYYRHLSLISPIIKLFLCFIAGFGFEKIVEIKDANKTFMTLSLLGAFVLMGIAVFLVSISFDRMLSIKLVAGLVHLGSSRVDPTTGQSILVTGLPIKINFPWMLKELHIYAFFSFVFSLFFFLLSSNKGIAQRKRIICYLLLFHILNLYTYKFIKTQQFTSALTEKQLAATEFTPLVYSKRRVPLFVRENSRDTLLDALQIHPRYWSTNIFFFKDEIGHSLRTDHWLKPFDRFTKTYWNQPFDDPTQPPQGLSPYNFLQFPLHHLAAVKFGGLEKEKIQFFSSVYTVLTDTKMSALMSDKQYAGDIMFVNNSQVKTNEIPNSIRWDDEYSLGANHRREIKYDVTEFDSNNFSVSVTVPDKDGGFLMYSDIWHPMWRATVDKKPARIFQANLAYKAVFVPHGEHAVHFFFKSRLFDAAFLLISLFSVFWFLKIIVLSGKMVKTGDF